MLPEIYLDNAATTQPYEQVRQIVVSMMDARFGNASSLHRRGVAAEAVINNAKAQLLSLVGTSSWQVIFTSGGTEANNLAVTTAIPRGKRKTVITTSVEHASVVDSCKTAVNRGAVLQIIGAGSRGVVSTADIERAVDKTTGLVSVIHVANEMCTVQPVNEIARRVKKLAPRAKVHVDAVQAAAQLPRLDYCKEVDMVTMSSHKIHGPQGVGALFIRPGTALKPLFSGGDQQHGYRPGTYNLPGIAGMGLAAELTVAKRLEGTTRMKEMRDLFIQQVCNDDVRLLSTPDDLAPGMLVLAVRDMKSEVLLHTLEKHGVLLSSGSACHSSRKDPPRCLVDAGLEETDGVIRISLSYENNTTEMADAARRLSLAMTEIKENRAGV